jgi:hypothetical protein
LVRILSTIFSNSSHSIIDLKFIINGKLRGVNSGGALGALIAVTLIHLDWEKLLGSPSLGASHVARAAGCGGAVNA